MTLSEFFEKNNKIAVAFSGGTDSAYLLYAAKKYGAEVIAYCVKSPFQPQFELDDATKIAKQLGIDIKLIDVDILSFPQVVENTKMRCYYCKQLIFKAIICAAKADGIHIVCDGTNATDNADERPGMKALTELGVKSPLRQCGLTKEQIRNQSEKAGLFTANKPAYACLATRIPTGESITAHKLLITENAENYLFSLGFSDFRVRYFYGCAKIQLKENQLDLFIKYRKDILKKLSKLYMGATLDLEVR